MGDAECFALAVPGPCPPHHAQALQLLVIDVGELGRLADSRGREGSASKARTLWCFRWCRFYCFYPLYSSTPAKGGDTI